MRGSAKCCYPILAYHSRLGFFEVIEAERAKQRQLAGVSIKVQETLGSNEPKGEKGKSVDIVAKSVGLSPTT